jgi:hypothetical protein
MRSSNGRAKLHWLCAGAVCGLLVLCAPARADEPAQGFALERFYASAPGAGYFVMDTLSQSGPFAGTMGLTFGYARDSLQLRAAGSKAPLSVVSERTFVDLGFAGTYDRLRVYFNFEMPLTAQGQSGQIGGYTFVAPNVNLSSHPDLIADARFGADVRLLGAPDGPARLGASAQVFFPNGDREDYMSDDTFRAILRALLAGDLGRFSYAGQLGVHVRPLNESPILGSPLGSELVFGLAVGARAQLSSDTSVVLGPELFGETAFAELFRGHATGLECLVGGRLETPVDNERILRIKLAFGGGLHARFGAPEWRALVGLELSGQAH